MTKHLQRAEFESSLLPASASGHYRAQVEELTSGSLGFRLFKRGSDIVMAVMAMPVVAIAALVLSIINPIWNAGPVFYTQKRMGRDCKPFRAIKFRTMRPADEILRGPDDPLEADRITPLGHFLRKTRIDEIPQFINVLIGDMSAIGPRPDYWDHAQHYLETIPGYRYRHVVRPGISGLAQVDAGYAEGIDATVQKARYDLLYIRGGGPRMEAYVLWRTLIVVFTGFGAR